MLNNDEKELILVRKTVGTIDSPVNTVVKVLYMESETPSLLKHNIIQILHIFHILHFVDEPSDNVLWTSVLDFNSDILPPVDPSITVIREKVYCKDCRREVVHICIEDKLLVLKGPVSMKKMCKLSKIQKFQKKTNCNQNHIL